MSLPDEPRTWFAQSPQGEPLPFSCDHLGIRYSGEIIRADNWLPQWGQPLTGETYFRIVMLQQHAGEFNPSIQDARIAVCLPEGTLSRRQRRIASELSTTRDTQASYLTQPDPESDLIRQTLQRRLEGLEEQMLGEESVRYSEGQVLTAGGPGSEAAVLFAGLDPNEWFSRLAGWLLSQAYPTLPIEMSSMPFTMDGEAAASLFHGLFDRSGTTPEILRQLGPSLGFSDSATEGLFRPEDCRIFDLLRSHLSAQDNVVQWPEVHHFLAHHMGLTGPFATLYLLLYLYWEPVDLAVDLSPGHQLRLANERPLLGNRLTSDLIPALVWDERLTGWAQIIGPDPDPEWEDALQHLSSLSPRILGADLADDVPAQEHLLLEDVTLLSRKVAHAQELTQLLGRAQQLLGQMGRALEGGTGAIQVDEALTRLSRLTGDGYQSIYRSIRGAYPDHRGLETDLALLSHLADLGDSIDDVLSAQEYLEGARVPSDLYPALSIDRQALQAALSPARLVESRGRIWVALAQDITQFKGRFRSAYRSHHESVHFSLPRYTLDYESARLKLAALELFNTIPELGEPAGIGFNDRLAELVPSLSPCLVSSTDLVLETTPWCEACQLRLDQSLPDAHLGRIIVAIDTDLGAKNRRLSVLLVEKILQGQPDERLDDFIKIVQASDLSALSNTLTPELVTFIRGMLG